MILSRRHLLRIAAAFSLSAMLAAPVLAADAPRVLLKTSMGDITLELNPEKAPVSVDNFLKYVKKGQYNGTVFHRIINGFMIQGGGYDQNMREKATEAPIKNEANNGLKNEVYTIAMARTSAPHSATAQFFINVANNAPLDYPSRDGWGYAVFGKVVQGADVVDKIKQVPTGAGDVPRTPVVIESATPVK